MITLALPDSGSLVKSAEGTRARMAARLRHFVFWSYEDKGLFLAVFASLGVLLMLCAFVVGQATPLADGYLDRAVLRVAIRNVELFLFGSLVLAVFFFRFVWHRRRSPRFVNAYLRFALLVFVAELFYIVYLVGFLSAGILIVVTTVCITRFAFDRPLGNFVLGLSVAGIVTFSLLQSTGNIVYAPAFLRGSGALFKQPVVVWAGCISVLAVLGLLYGMLDFIAARMHEMSTTDSLTQVFNRRYFMSVFVAEFERAARNGRCLSMLIVDVDFFKRINDTYGHLVGDGALRVIAQLLRHQLRAYDVVCRYGGEEFAILLPETNAGEALRIAERCREAIGAFAFAVREEVFSATVSIGVACIPDHGALSIDQFTHLADQALYRAKQTGRNRVVVTPLAQPA